MIHQHNTSTLAGLSDRSGTPGRRRHMSSSDRPTCNRTLTGNVARQTVSTGPVLNRRSSCPRKHWIGPIQFLVDRAFSNSHGTINHKQIEAQSSD